MGSKCSPCDRAQQHPARGIAENNPACLGLEAVLLSSISRYAWGGIVLRKCPKPNSPPWGVVTWKLGIHRTWWIWSVCKCVCLILWGFRHFVICFYYDWIAKGDGWMGAPSCRESCVYIYLCIYIYMRVCVYVCVRRCVYMLKRAHVHVCVYLYINKFCFVLCL